MKIKLKHHKSLGDWYTIVRAEHDGREWFERINANSISFMCSERLSPEACIEGNAEEMIILARSIRKGQAVSFKRCAVHFEADGVHLYSPKNSTYDGVVSIEEANELADQIMLELTDIYTME